MVESQLPKLLVAGSIPVSRSIRLRARRILARYGAMPAVALAKAGNPDTSMRRLPTVARRNSIERRWAVTNAPSFGWQAVITIIQ